MGIRVGVPILKLSASNKASKRSGNAKSVIEEMLNERYSKDQDLDRTRSHLNTYTGFTSGKKLYEYWQNEANAHTDALGRHLRSDAVIGYAVILKPDIASMQGMSEAEQERFNADGTKVLCDILQEHGLQVDATAVHRDEMNLHTHIAGHDIEYKAGKKINLKLFNDFNKEFPKRMRALGYDVEDMSVYDSEAVKSMTKEEQDVYKSEHIALKRSKKHGQDSNNYKAEKIAEAEREVQKVLQNAKEQAENIINRANAEAERIKTENAKKLQELDEKEKLYRKREVQLEQDKESFKAEKDAVISRKVQIDVLRQEVEKDKAKAENELKMANMALQDIESIRSKYQQAYNEAKEIAEGFYEHSFYENFKKNLQKRLEKQKYRDGRDGWQVFGQMMIDVVRETQMDTISSVPFMQYQRNVDDRVRKTDKQVNKVKCTLLNVNMSQNQNDDYQY